MLRNTLPLDYRMLTVYIWKENYMFHKVRFRLTALCMAVTGVILAVLTIICLSFSETNLRNQEQSSYEANLTTTYQTLRQQSTLSHNWLRQIAARCQFTLRIRDNGTELFFQQLSPNAETEALLDLAEETALQTYGIPMETASAPLSTIYHREFPLPSAEERLLASIALIPYHNGTLAVTVLHPLSRLGQQIAHQRKLFLLADLAAFTLLSLFFWFFITRMLKPLEENRKKQMQFIASASHELRSPLTVILSNTDAVRSQSMPADSQFLDTITQEGQRMSRLISDMLQLAGADNHSWNIHPVHTELDTLLLQTWESYETLAGSKNLRWQITLPPKETPPCLCDPERIRQLLAILIDNAFSYTPAGGWVKLSLKHSTSHFNLTISDNGPGIPSAQKEAVFERFYRGDPSRRDKNHFGLGLSIAREIARLHRGELLLKDTPGGGCTFTLVLPATETE